MINGSLIRMNNLKGKNSKVLYAEYKELIEVDDNSEIIIEF